jgi:N-acyl homoserine lactone hydrolase
MHLRIRPLCVGKTDNFEKSILTYFRNQGIKTEGPFIIWVIEGGDRTIVVDSGPADPEIVLKEPGRVYYRRKEEQPAQALKSLGLNPLNVEIVVCTHLHWDHCGNFSLFPNANIYVQKKELEFAVAPFEIFGDVYEASIYQHNPKWISSMSRFRIIEGDMDLAPGVKLLHLPGHTPGLQGVLVTTRKGKYCITSDAVNLYENWENRIPPGIHIDIGDCYRSFRKIEVTSDYILPSHDMRVLEKPVYP